MLVIRFAITVFRSLLVSADWGHELWRVLTPSEIALNPREEEPSEWPTVIAEQLISSVKLTFLFFYPFVVPHLSLKDVTMCCRHWVLLECLTEYVLTSRRTRSYKICQNQSNPLWAGLAGPGHRRARRAVLTTQFRHFYSSRLLLATSHCPSNAMSKFFTFNIF